MYSKIKDPGDPDSRTQAQREAFADFKRDIEHKATGVMLHSLLMPSRSGMTQNCGDKKRRVGYPGIPIISIDGEEACAICLTKAANANYPCAKCLVHQSNLDKIDKQYPLRASADMRAVYMESLTKSTATAANDLRKEYGIQGTEVNTIVLSRCTQTDVGRRISSGICAIPTHINLIHTTHCTLMTLENLATIFGRYFKRS